MVTRVAMPAAAVGLALANLPLPKTEENGGDLANNEEEDLANNEEDLARVTADMDTLLNHHHHNMKTFEIAEGSREESEEPSPFLGLMVGTVLVYCAVSLAMVYFNKWLFTSHFKFPVFVSWAQQLIGFGLFNLGAETAKHVASLQPVFPAARLERSVVLKCIPMTMAFVISIGLSNLCLQYTQISTYQVARSLTLIFVPLFSYVLMRQTESLRTWGALGLIMAGFVVNSLDPSTLSVSGLFTGAFSSLFQAVYNVLIKKLLPFVDGNNQKLLFYNLALSSLLFIPMTLLADGTDAWAMAFTGSASEKHESLAVIWIGLVVSAILGTALNMTQYLAVRLTSPLTFMIIGMVKATLQTIGGFLIFGDKLTLESALGISASILGSSLYGYSKYSENRSLAARNEAANHSPSESTGSGFSSAKDVDAEASIKEQPAV